MTQIIDFPVPNNQRNHDYDADIEEVLASIPLKSREKLRFEFIKTIDSYDPYFTQWSLSFPETGDETLKKQIYRSQSLRFLFASNDKISHTSVISVVRMFATTPTVEGTQAQVGLRMYKMVKRAIGEQYFGLPRSASIADIMYAPIMSLEDIDAMGVDYRR
jgi:hypothetical protein